MFFCWPLPLEFRLDRVLRNVVAAEAVVAVELQRKRSRLKA